MAERFPDNRNLSTLPVELKVHLGFIDEPNSGWLISDDLVNVGGVEHYEWLPARARVSREGTRYEIGARKQDLDGLLALGRILNSDVQNLDTITNFWKGHKKFSVFEDEDWVFIGTDIEPLPIAFEEAFNPVSIAYDLALTAALKNMTYEQLAAHDWHGGFLRSAESSNGGRTLLFSTLSEEMGLTDAHHQEIKVDEEKVIAADTLREFPLATNKTSLSFASTTVVRDGVAKEFDSIWLIAHNGKDPNIFDGDERVDMYIHESTFNHDTDKWEHDGIDLHLQIPKGVEVKTVEDMAKLTKAEVSPKDDLGDLELRKRILDVDVAVEDDVVKVVSKDESLSVEVRKPTCDECSIPMWKFPWPKEDEFMEERINPGKRFRMHSISTSLGIYRCQVRNEDGHENTYCHDCVQKVEDRYAQDHPFVLRPRAIDVARARLDNLGYEDVEIWEDQVWRMESLGGGKGWEFFTKLEYNRDGRKIIRHTGISILTDGGEFKPNMFPREYVTFRYQ